MKSFIKKSLSIIFVLCFMFIGLSIFSATKVNASATVYAPAYTFATAKSTGNTAYASTYDVTINTVRWNVPGNQNFSGFVRIGGKSLDEANRVIYSKDPINYDVTKITINDNGVNNVNLVVNSITMEVYSSAAGAAAGGVEDRISVLDFSYDVEVATENSESKVRPDGVSWNNRYYRLTYNVSNSKSSNYGIDLQSIVFYKTTTQYEISFNANGGTGTDPDTLEALLGENSDALPANPYTRDGHSFVGWNTQADGNGTSYDPSDVITSVSEDIVLYAKWSSAASHTVHFYDTIANADFTTKDVIEGGKTNAGGIDTGKFSYTFDGWYTKNGTSTSDWGSVFDFENTAINAETTVYAKYSTASWVTNFEANETGASLKFETDTIYDWTLVTDASDLHAGDKVAIVAKGYNYAMSKTQNTNNRGCVDIVKSVDNFDQVFNLQVFTLVDGTKDGSYGFYTGDGYIYAASKDSNYLKTEGTLSDNSSFTISIGGDGTATITAQGENTHNLLKYNSSNKLFSCYASGQQAVAIYKGSNGVATFTYAAIRFGLKMTVAEYTAFSAAGTLGIQLTYDKGSGSNTYHIDFDSSKIKRVNAAGELDAEGDYYQFALVVTGLEDYTDLEIEAKAYVTDGAGNYVYAQKAGTTNNAGADYSFEDMIVYYYDHSGTLGLTSEQISALTRAKTLLGL